MTRVAELRVRKQRKQATRRAIVDAAFALGAARGFGALGLREVARAAGIAPTSFYRHFPDMDALTLALLDEVGLSLRRLLRQARQRIDPGRSVVRTSLEAFMDYVREHPHPFRLLLESRASGSALLRGEMYREFDRFVAELAEDLARDAAVRARPLGETALVARAIVAVVFDAGAEALDMPPSGHADLAERIIFQVRLILRGAEAGAAGWAPQPRRRARKDATL